MELTCIKAFEGAVVQGKHNQGVMAVGGREGSPN